MSFPEESKAYQAQTVLRELMAQGSVRLHGAAVVERRPEGDMVVRDGSVGENFGVGTGSGSLIGMMVGILGGPFGMLLGTMAGGLIGSAVDASRASETSVNMRAVSNSIAPGTTALVAEIEELHPAQLDGAVQRLGGQVHRWPESDLRREAENYRA
ncbi:MAG: DUF1269 domain-containing protein [Deinococcus sp.]|nr:DUF1269 domain-containing protein [Deinococcus sp.]